MLIHDFMNSEVRENQRILKAEKLVILNNVFKKLKDTFDKELIGIGPSAHLMSDTIKVIGDNFLRCIESVILKIFSYLYCAS